VARDGDDVATLDQIVGKVQLAFNPMTNHWWHATLHVNARGFGSNPIACGQRFVEFEFDFIDHELCICTSDGDKRIVALRPRSVADFYRAVMAELASLGVKVRIWPVPQEIADPIPLDQDEVHAAYDAEYAERFWRALVQCDRVMNLFRARFIGKVSPVHLFWGGLDLAVTRFRAGWRRSIRACPAWPISSPVRRTPTK
jgi:hypothetical protein